MGEFFGPVVIGDMLLGLDAEHYKADLNTDAAAMYLKNRQGADGHWAYLAADTAPADLFRLHRANRHRHARDATLAPNWNGQRTTRPFNWPRRGSPKSSPKATKIAAGV